MRTDTDVLLSKADQLQRDVQKLNSIIDELSSVRKQLQSQGDKSLDMMCLVLKAFGSTMGTQRDSYKRLQSLTSSIASKYLQCEKKVSRRANEYTIRKYPPTVVAISDIHRIPWLQQFVKSAT